MRTTIFLTLLPIASILLPACSGSTHDDIVQEFIAGSGQAFTSCGAYEVPATCGAPSADQSKAISCLVQGFAACKPVRLDLTRATVEGDPIYTTYLVVPKEGGCYVEELIDDRKDRFGDGEPSQSACDSIQEMESCPWVAADGCISECSSGKDCG